MKIGFFGMLALIFITLKLTNVILWSWVWVLAPLWMPIAITLLVFLLIAIGVVNSNSYKRRW
jgi:hypothetical protein